MSPLVTFNKILVPHDGSKSSDRALEYAVKIAGENKECEIIIMHVISSFPVPFSSAKHGRIKASSPSYLHDIYQEMESNADKILDKLKQSWASSSSEFPIRTHVVIGGNIAQRIVGYAKKHAIDLIVINSRAEVLWVPTPGLVFGCLLAVFLEQFLKWLLARYSLLDQYNKGVLA